MKITATVVQAKKVNGVLQQSRLLSAPHCMKAIEMSTSLNANATHMGII